MKTLILMRHAKAEPPKPGQPDGERGLAPRGRLASALMGAWLREVQHVPDIALVSGAVRTRETWAGLGLPCEASFDDGLYLADPETILAAIRAAPKGTCLLVLGHNPGMEAAMGMIGNGARISAPTAATAIYSLPTAHWRDADFGVGSLIAFETPKSLV